jgi:hypothetical protein
MVGVRVMQIIAFLGGRRMARRRPWRAAVERRGDARQWHKHQQTPDHEQA